MENEKEADDKDLFEVSRIVSLRILNGLPAYEVAYKGYRKKSDNRIVLKSDVIQTYARAELEEKKLKQRFRQSASGNWRVEKVAIGVFGIYIVLPYLQSMSLWFVNVFTLNMLIIVAYETLVQAFHWIGDEALELILGGRQEEARAIGEVEKE